MNIINITEPNERGSFKVTVSDKYCDISLDDKLKLCRDLRADWVGACTEKGTVIILRKRKEIITKK